MPARQAGTHPGRFRRRQSPGIRHVRGRSAGVLRGPEGRTLRGGGGTIAQRLVAIGGAVTRGYLHRQRHQMPSAEQSRPRTSGSRNLQAVSPAANRDDSTEAGLLVGQLGYADPLGAQGGDYQGARAGLLSEGLRALSAPPSRRGVTSRKPAAAPARRLPKAEGVFGPA